MNCGLRLLELRQMRKGVHCMKLVGAAKGHGRGKEGVGMAEAAMDALGRKVGHCVEVAPTTAGADWAATARVETLKSKSMSYWDTEVDRTWTGCWDTEVAVGGVSCCQGAQAAARRIVAPSVMAGLPSRNMVPQWVPGFVARRRHRVHVGLVFSSERRQQRQRPGEGLLLLIVPVGNSFIVGVRPGLFLCTAARHEFDRGLVLLTAQVILLCPFGWQAGCHRVLWPGFGSVALFAPKGGFGFVRFIQVGLHCILVAATCVPAKTVPSLNPARLEPLNTIRRLTILFRLQARVAALWAHLCTRRVASSCDAALIHEAIAKWHKPLIRETRGHWRVAREKNYEGWG
mmetsp:Transcript_63472/g.102843  ORF Transcript_63472/g.102843 Transcript_63472/m.102843 type:complete len:344 (+) Transcript_63472:721-1752(+)